MTRILVVRHGPTEWNALSRIQGRADLPLSDEGRIRVRDWRLPDGWRSAVCLSSPLRRALETARILGLTPEPDERLIEMDWGAWEGRRLADLRRELGEAMAANERRGLDFRPSGGESPRDVQSRLGPLLQQVSEPTIFVTHKGVLRALYALASGWSMEQDAPDKLRDGCAHVFAMTAGAVAVVQLNIPLTCSS